MKTQNIKFTFHFLTIILLLGLIGAFILGFKLDYFGNTDPNYPAYKAYIFYGYGIMLFICVTFYVKFLIKYDEEISKKEKK